MKNLLYKEFRLAIHPLYFIVPLLGGLILIPNWLYYIALSYVFFISIVNIFAAYKAQNDIGFSVMLPVRKSDTVKSRILAIVIIELVHIAVAVVFGVINSILYPYGNFFLEPNAAFFGFGLMMYGLFNVIFFPMFFKTGYKIGIPAIIATFAGLAFAAGVELFALLVPWAKYAFDMPSRETLIWKLGALFAGIVVFILTNYIAFKLSAKRFERLDL